jgi:hypothetical protein
LADFQVGSREEINMKQKPLKITKLLEVSMLATILVKTEAGDVQISQIRPIRPAQSSTEDTTREETGLKNSKMKAPKTIISENLPKRTRLT